MEPVYGVTDDSCSFSLTLGAETEAETKAPCKLGGLTKSRLRRHFILLQGAIYNLLGIG